MTHRINIDVAGNRFTADPAERLGARWGAYEMACRAAGLRTGRSDGKYYQGGDVATLHSFLGILHSSGFDPVVTTSATTPTPPVASTGLPQGHPLRGVLYPFQIKGALTLAASHRHILADEPGLGKTIQVLAAQWLVHPRRPMIVICPAVAKGVWEDETRRWRPDLQPYMMNGRGSFRWPGPGEVGIVNYDVLPPALIAGAPAGFVCAVDEAHACKDPKAQRTKRTRLIATQAWRTGGFSWPMTGTPLPNEPADLRGILCTFAMMGDTFGSAARFDEAFRARDHVVRLKRKGTNGLDEWYNKVVGKIYGDPELSVPSRLGTVMTRRTKKQVLPELPPKRFQVIRVPLSRDVSKLCDDELRALGGRGYTLLEALEWLLRRGDEVLPTFPEMSRCRALLAQAKAIHVVAKVEEYEAAGEPLIVASAHRSVIDMLARRSGWAPITGDVPGQKRQAIARDFQAGRYKGLACVIAAAKESLTLTHGCNMLFVDQAWRPGDNEQMMERIHRVTQARPVLIMFMQADHVLDRHVNQLNWRKQGIIDASLPMSEV